MLAGTLLSMWCSYLKNLSPMSLQAYSSMANRTHVHAGVLSVADVASVIA